MANGYSMGMTGGVMPISADDVKIISDNIENYSTILVTESTPNLSEILSYQFYGNDSGFTFYKDPSLQIIYAVSDNLKNKSTSILQTRGSGLQNVVPDQITESDIFNVIPTISVFTNQSDLESTIPQQRSQVSNVNQSVIVNRSRYTYPSVSNRTSFNRVSNFASSITYVNRFTYPSLR
jgi:hypothetical protein